MLYRISREGRLVLPRRMTKQDYNRMFQTISCNADKKKISFFPQTVRDWNPVSSDFSEAESLSVFKACLVTCQRTYVF